MKMRLQCMPCFVKQVLMEFSGSSLPAHEKERAMRKALKILSEIDYDLPPVGVSLVLHRELMKFGVAEDPYHDLKIESNNKTLEILYELKKMVDSSDQRLEMAAKIAIAGNVVDYGAANQLDLKATLENAMERGMKIDDTERFKEDLSNAVNISYYLDNSGEAVLDGLFMKEMIEFNPGLKITAYAKKVPLLNDVTVDDCRKAGLDDIPGVDIKALDEEGWATAETVRKNGGDIIISKGQGNYESLSEVGGIYFLLVVKCGIIHQELGASIGEMVFKRSD
jgi:hypothetical protein